VHHVSSPSWVFIPVSLASTLVYHKDSLTIRSIAVLTYVSVSATRIGISHDFSFYFVAIANAASLFGRYAAGMICDSIGQSQAFY
jgi:hypothetical protein